MRVKIRFINRREPVSFEGASRCSPPKCERGWLRKLWELDLEISLGRKQSGICLWLQERLVYFVCFQEIMVSLRQSTQDRKKKHSFFERTLSQNPHQKQFMGRNRFSNTISCSVKTLNCKMARIYCFGLNGFEKKKVAVKPWSSFSSCEVLQWNPQSTDYPTAASLASPTTATVAPLYGELASSGSSRSQYGCIPSGEVISNKTHIRI